MGNLSGIFSHLTGRLLQLTKSFSQALVLKQYLSVFNDRSWNKLKFVKMQVLAFVHRYSFIALAPVVEMCFLASKFTLEEPDIKKCNWDWTK